jgi:hypothetical protein
VGYSLRRNTVPGACPSFEAGRIHPALTSLGMWVWFASLDPRVRAALIAAAVSILIAFGALLRWLWDQRRLGREEARAQEAHEGQKRKDVIAEQREHLDLKEALNADLRRKLDDLNGENQRAADQLERLTQEMKAKPHILVQQRIEFIALAFILRTLSPTSSESTNSLVCLPPSARLSLV